MQRYFVNASIGKGIFAICGDDSRHISQVMRMKQGDLIICCGPDGRCAKCRIEQFSPKSVQVRVIDWLTDVAELPVQVTIAQGLPRGGKPDLIVQKGTELGAYAFQFFQAKRSEVRWDPRKSDQKTKRLQRIAKEAAEQSHRSRIPKIGSVQTLQELLEQSKSFDVKIVAYEEEKKNNALPTVLSKMSKNESMLVMIGPEGGFTEEEITVLCTYGFITCGLGPRILRTETAPFYLLSAISYQFELME